MRILCISAQKPDSTGSGVYLAETVRSMIAQGHEVAVIAGIDRDDAPQLPAGTEFFPVRFRTDALPFPVCGMSDVMPYEATRYRDMTPDMVDAFRAAFAQRIREVLLAFKPDAVICYHLYLVCSVAAEVLDELAGENWSPGWARSDSPSGKRPCRIWGISHSTDLRQLRNHTLEHHRIFDAVRRLDGIMALHEAQKAEIVELFNVDPANVRVVGTGYNAHEFAPRPALRAANPLRVLYVGKLCRAKGVESLVRAFNLLPFDPETVELCLVGMNEKFKAYAEKLGRAALAANAADVEALKAASYEGESVEDILTDAIHVLGENIQLPRATTVAAGGVATYIHGGGKIGVVVTFDIEGIDPASEGFQTYGRDVAMQVAAASPVAATRESVPAEVVEHEKAIYKAQAAESGKPENIQEKMATGRLEKFYKENCLTEQAFVKNPDQTVNQYTEEAAKNLGGSIKVTGFVRWALGETA